MTKGLVSSPPLFLSEELAALDPLRIPSHIAIIMDGNRRWAKQRGLPPLMGHWEGAEILTEIVRAAAEIGVKTLTLYAFSTENWQRPEEEVEDLMHLFEVYLERKREAMVEDGIRLGAIGDLSRLPEEVRRSFEETKLATEGCEKINLVLALNYGGRDELRRTFLKLLQACEEGHLSPEEITEEEIGRHLDTAPWGDPELLIRTSGELRLSNFLLWQISYSELYISDIPWPDFSPRSLLEAVIAYQGRSRRLGGGL